MDVIQSKVGDADIGVGFMAMVLLYLAVKSS